MRDTFVWNLNADTNSRSCTPEIFAQSIVDDYTLPSSYHFVITKAIQDQLSDFKAHSTTFGEDGVFVSSDTEDIQRGIIDNKEAEWWDAWRKAIRSPTFHKCALGRADVRSRERRKVVKEEAVATPVVPAVPGVELPMAVDDFDDDDSSMQEELQILVKVSTVALNIICVTEVIRR
ncbi:hypothetical protein FOMPIDRAFT_1120847 [Fomitopsis schrenkii]|uniref:Uncharacterized protein n=1 Tax=Fomitopsis schrenkii TaxID=2126942 RepID=S8FIK7_FOMSC|nr:hypothetical protein FOMPIDRAFT_1120847 [Fomitopsis schrenkii]